MRTWFRVEGAVTSRRVASTAPSEGPRWDTASLGQHDALDGRNVNTVTLLELYMTMVCRTLVVMILMSMKLLESHGMRSATTLCLAGFAGAVWPLLAFAALQTGGVLVLAKGLHLFRRQPKVVRCQPSRHL